MVSARLALDAGGGKQGRETGIAPPGQHFEAARDKGPVEAGQLHHVRHRAERHEIEPFAQVGLRTRPVMAAPAKRTVGGHDQQEDHPDRGKAAERAGLVRAVGVHEGKRFRKAGFGQVMVEDDAFEADPGGVGKRREGSGAAIDRQHQPVSRLREPVEGRIVRAVAFGQPVRHMDRCRTAGCAEKPREQRCRSCTVHIVICEYGHRFARFGGVGEPFGREIHVPEAGRVRQGGPELRPEEGPRRFRRHAPVDEHARGDIRQPLSPGYRRRRPGIARPLAPGPAPERPGHPENRACGADRWNGRPFFSGICNRDIAL